MNKNQWVRTTKPNPNATARLLCLPYAGGGAAVYRQWQAQLPNHVEVCAIQLPGRENRIRDQVYLRIQPLVQEIAQALLPFLDRPFTIFGHSMGSLIAYELTQQLKQKYDRLPQQLMVSGRRSPLLPDPDTKLHKLSDDDFFEQVQARYNAIPDLVQQEPELRALFLPLLRADFEKVETYIPTYVDPLPCPIMAFGGQSDERASQAEMQAWSRLTTTDFNLHMVPGGHFYLNDDPKPLLNQISRILTDG